ncbi:MAG TPA: ABC transporter ATP-binding protein [Erysipelotrichaceae bacterium]|nr:ABC transporter ATP-binding protein [Erysipelotrichia bacterium]HPX32537.1 ABC transporter ATP-binding protein [Erysipelotrichaceae bacterium]HQA84616.1 ABC transporter ATP-binding protein [Erysipelotrichaceae bacterium]
MIKLDKAVKKYKVDNKDLLALNYLDLILEENCFVAIVGVSGCGKSTLLNVIAGYDKIDYGYYYFNNKDVNKFSKKEKSKLIKNIGVIFQDFNLLEYLTVKENILLATRYMNSKKDLLKVAKKLDILDILNKYPSQLSGGQKQRVAIARCLITNKKIILADEPTGSLDKDNAIKIMEIFKKLNDEGIAIVIVTHDENIASRCKKIIRMENGRVVN